MVNRLFRLRSKLRAGSALSLLVLGVFIGVKPAAAEIVDNSAKIPSAQIDLLIERLGSVEFAQREKARIDLMELGVDAFDSLNRARLHDDVEIRKQAEYLLRAIRVVWIRDGDDPKVKELLQNYRTGSLDDRESRLKRLARLENAAGIEPLCRLVRFETSENLSKRAALLVMNAELPERADGMTWDAVIDNVIRSSERPAARWMRLYASYLRNPSNTLDDWDQLVRVEELDTKKRPDKIRLVILRDFLRWRVDSLERLGRRDDAVRMMWRTLDVQNASNADLLGTVDWLIERTAWPLVDVLAEKYSDRFEADPKLLYRQAEAALGGGEVDRAEELAKVAIKLLPEQPQFRIELAQDLQTRGLLEWAENEYLRLIEVSEPISVPGFDARIRLGWLLHDLARNEDAYETLNQLVELVEQEPGQRVLREMERNVARIRGQMYYSLALHLESQEKWEEQRQALEKAIGHDPRNADILIAMYRVPQAGEDFAKKTRDLISKTVAVYGREIAALERGLLPNVRSRNTEYYALMLNQYAWLVANTEGDFREALRYSKKSLELAPDEPGYLDTLARCHYAVGDYELAVARQREAVRGDPHSGQIQRQLQLFEQKLEEQKLEEQKLEEQEPSTTAKD